MSELTLKFDYSKLKTTQYVGEFGEQLVRLNFIINQIDTFVPIIDDKAIDLIARFSEVRYYDVQVKTVRLKESSYFYGTKEKWGEKIRKKFLVAVVVLIENESPVILLIPGHKWEEESKNNKIFSDRNYEGKKSKPEWGLQISRKNLPYLIEHYEINKVLEELKKGGNDG